MLKVVLAGLVISKVLTLEEAERIDVKLHDKVLPKSVKECVDEIIKAKNEKTN